MVKTYEDAHKRIEDLEAENMMLLSELEYDRSLKNLDARSIMRHGKHHTMILLLNMNAVCPLWRLLMLDL